MGAPKGPQPDPAPWQLREAETAAGRGRVPKPAPNGGTGSTVPCSEGGRRVL